VATFFLLVAHAWELLDRNLQLARKSGIDAAAFRAARAEHVGVAEPDRLPG
jgi:hypothetical protein